MTDFNYEMIKFNINCHIMKNKIYILFVFVILSTACEVNEGEADVKFTDLADTNMKIIPDNPTVNDEIKLLIFNDCTYNIIAGVTRIGNKIEIEKRFNSMMKWPCILKTDTILLGKLPNGDYVVNYKLVDTSIYVKDPLSFSINFKLTVSK